MIILNKAFPVIISACVLTACGGGGDDSTDSPDTGTPIVQCNEGFEWNIIDAGNNLELFLEPNYQQGKPSAIIAKFSNRDSKDLNFEWQQLTGSPLALVSSQSPVLNFTPNNSGVYQFSVNVTGSGIDIQHDFEVNVTAENQVYYGVNSDHQVVEGNGVSVRLTSDITQATNNTQWCSDSSINLNLDLSNGSRPLFTAPTVSQDTIVTLNATANVNGQTYTDNVHLLVTNESPITSEYFDSPVARTYPYNNDSPYSAALSQCVYSNSLNESCAISRLPLIGQQRTAPTIDEIMDRVIVSHDWMGANFKRFLIEKDVNNDFKTLLQSVTAVVISYDVRPSFYWVVTGAIYLDPNNLWMTPEQRDTINEAPDFRSDFGNDLQFLVPWRHVKNNDYVYRYYDPEIRVSRTLNDLTPRLASLLYHELAHANDFFPRSVHAQLTGPTLLDDFYRRANNSALVSDQLALNSPLQSSEMYSLAEVSFKGETANNTQKAYKPSDVTSFFKPDHASDFYSYSSTREDAAMLFEEALMSHRYNILRDVAITNNPENASGSNIIVDWGQRGRIGEPSIKPRAEYVIDQMLPEVGSQQLVDNLPAPIQMVAGKTWLENVVLMSPSNAVIQQRSTPQTIQSTLDDSRPLELSGSQHR
ncbi:hypothetical protein [Shewanella gaetbuli]